MMCFITKVTPVNNIDGKYHYKEIKSTRSCLLTDCYEASFNVNPGLYACMNTHTHALTFRTKAILRNQIHVA